MNPKEELKSIVNSGRIPHSLLFQGPNGSGKLQAAIDFASNVLNIGVQSTTNIIEKSLILTFILFFLYPHLKRKKKTLAIYTLMNERDFVLENNFM